MLAQKNYPKIYWYNGTTFTDASFYMLNYGRDPLTMHMHTNHFLYFGRVKPFNAFYIEMHNASNVNTTLAVQYYNGSSWVSVANLLDDTIAFTRSGFVQFDKPSDWASNSVNSTSLYWVRMAVAQDTANNTQFQGINLVFSDDEDLKGVYPYVTGYLTGQEKTFILRHENSRDLIIQDIRTRGFRKTNAQKTRYENIDAWDLMDINEVRMWSTYLTMENIFSSLQSQEGDLYKEKSIEYKAKAEFYKNLVYLTLDKDDDGIVSNTESAQDISTRRLVRR